MLITMMIRLWCGSARHCNTNAKRNAVGIENFPDGPSNLHTNDDRQGLTHRRHRKTADEHHNFALQSENLPREPRLFLGDSFAADPSLADTAVLVAPSSVHTCSVICYSESKASYTKTQNRQDSRFAADCARHTSRRRKAFTKSSSLPPLPLHTSANVNLCANSKPKLTTAASAAPFNKTTQIPAPYNPATLDAWPHCWPAEAGLRSRSADRLVALVVLIKLVVVTFLKPPTLLKIPRKP